jgi:O-succinylbenzoate synthase
VELRLIRLPLVHFFETSFGRIDDKHFILVRVDGEGATGYGECVAEQDPYYSSETNETVWHIISEFVAPRVLGVNFAHPREVFPALKAIRGHNMAKAAVEMAAWDLFAKQRGQPLSRVLGGTHLRSGSSGGQARARIASGVSIGIQRSLDELAEKVERELAAGYRRIKIKIKPGWDLAAVETVRARFGAIPLMVDANAAYTAADADHLAQLDRFDLMMIEQPLDYDDIAEHAALQRTLHTPICLDESIKTIGIARRGDRRGRLPHHQHRRGVGGFAESIRLRPLRIARHSGLARRHARIGDRPRRQHPSVDPAQFTLPGDIAASKRYFDPDLIEPPIEVAADGTIAVPTSPGIGVVIREDRIAAATLKQTVLEAAHA